MGVDIFSTIRVSGGSGSECRNVATISRNGLPNLYPNLLSGISYSWHQIIPICIAKTLIDLGGETVVRVWFEGTTCTIVNPALPVYIVTGVMLDFILWQSLKTTTVIERCVFVPC